MLFRSATRNVADGRALLDCVRFELVVRPQIKVPVSAATATIPEIVSILAFINTPYGLQPFLLGRRFGHCFGDSSVFHMDDAIAKFQNATVVCNHHHGAPMFMRQLVHHLHHVAAGL